MAKIKTTFSIQEELLEQADSVARELGISRSRLFALAIEELLQRYENKQLLKKIDEAYTDVPDLDEALYHQKAHGQYRQILENEW